MATERSIVTASGRHRVVQVRRKRSPVDVRRAIDGTFGARAVVAPALERYRAAEANPGAAAHVRLDGDLRIGPAFSDRGQHSVRTACEHQVRVWSRGDGGAAEAGGAIVRGHDQLVAV